MMLSGGGGSGSGFVPIGGAATLGGLRILVTGAASGIGRATATFLSANGAAVAALDRLPADIAGVLYEPADVGDPSDVRRAVASAIAKLDGLDVLVNCAGIGALGGVEDNDDDEWRRVLDVNVLGVARVVREALPALRASQHAAIVNVSSIVATLGLPDRALYAASKGAVHALTLAMAADLLPEGIRVNAVVPGTTDTPWVARILAGAADPVAERAALEARQPHGRLVEPEEVAHAIAYLASPEAGSVTGTTLAVDGGMLGLRLRSSGHSTSQSRCPD